jgi:AcrR family transcriptional regulator
VAEPSSRRERARADTLREIKQTARRVLVDRGVDGLALRAVAREATTHHAEFGLLFGSAGERVLPDDFRDDCARPAQEAAARFGGVFAALVARVYLEQGFPVPADDELDPALQEQLTTWCAKLPVPLPLGVMSVFLSCWIRLYGMVCMEVFGHLRFALSDAGPMFEAELRKLAEVLGVGADYRPPG